MKVKTLITFDIQQQEICGKGLRNRRNANFILLAQIPDTGILYAATIESELSERYKKNQHEMVEKIT